MRPMRRPLAVLVLCLVLAFAPVAAQAAAHAPLALPRVPAFDLETVLGNAWSSVQSFVSKILVTGGGDGGTSTTQSTPTTGTSTPPPSGTGDNGPGIDPNG